MTSKPKRVARQHIPTWVERCDIHEGMVSNSTIQARMQDEIDDLRLALDVARQKLECISQCVANDWHKSIFA